MIPDEQLKLELSTALEEYRALKAEIVSNLDSGRQVATLTLTAVAALTAAAPYIIVPQGTIIFLIVPLLFYVLAWSQLRYIRLVLDMGAYLREVIVPHVQQILEETNTNRDFSYIMSWELTGKAPSRLQYTKLRRILFLPISGANYGIPLLAALLSISTFLVLKSQSQGTTSVLEILLIIVDIVALLYSAYLGIRAERDR